MFVIGACRAFEQTTLTTLLPGIVTVALLPRATAAAASATQLAIIAGPAVGGLLYAVNPVAGLRAVLHALYLRRTADRHGNGGARRRVARACDHASCSPGSPTSAAPDILGVISLDLFAVILGGVFALLPVFARDVFEAGPWGLGLLRASPGVGALIAAIVLTHWQLAPALGKIIFGGGRGLWRGRRGVRAVGRSCSRWPALAVLGTADMVSVVIRMTLMQLHTPDEMRGRISAVNSLFVTASNQLGEFRAGLMASWLGAIPAVLIGGIGALLVVLIGRKLFRALPGRHSRAPRGAERGCDFGAACGLSQ